LGEFSPNGQLFTLGSFLKKIINYPHFCATFFLSIDYYELILTEKWLGNILGDLLTNSSGHPGYKPLAVAFEFLFESRRMT
jgi:hypothetical protein